ENPQAVEQDDVDLPPGSLTDAGLETAKAFGITASSNGHTVERSRTEAGPAIAPGSRVVVHGIVAQPHLNGQFGTAVEFDEAEGRWKVAMDDGGGKMLRPGNLAACGQADGQSAGFAPAAPAAAPAGGSAADAACGVISPGDLASSWLASGRSRT
ncbi:unnamed protein product, partial [Prorocentrum cordatum]